MPYYVLSLEVIDVRVERIGVKIWDLQFGDTFLIAFVIFLKIGSFEKKNRQRFLRSLADRNCLQ